MVCVDLIGRLGNNLWQIAAAVGYSEKHGVPFQIPAWEYSNCFKTVFTTYAAGDTFYGETSWYFEELPFIENVKLFGYFQSYKYFNHCEGKIRELFQFNEQITGKIDSKYPFIKQGSNTCGIHVRRGDYIGTGLYEVCNLEYYKDAIEEIKNRTNIEMFVVFSDDIAWCKENLISDWQKGKLIGETFFLFVEDNSNIEDLYLMTQCSHNIICISSFSWWGAWLNANKDKIVIAPSRWYNDESKDARDILPEDWIKIKV